MEADRYRRELERKDRDISSVDEAIERIFAEEKRCQDVIDQRTRDLRNCKSESIIFNNAKVGMEHREFEAEIGKIYTAAMDNEAEYDCPSATFSVEATSFLDGKRHEYTLVILENDGYVCNAAIYE